MRAWAACQRDVDFSVSRYGIAQMPKIGTYMVQFYMADKSLELALEGGKSWSYAWNDSNLRNYTDQWENSYSNSYPVEADECTNMASNEGKRNQWNDVGYGTVEEVHEGEAG